MPEELHPFFVHKPAEKRPFLCPKCGGRLVARHVVDPEGRIMATFHHPRPQRE